LTAVEASGWLLDVYADSSQGVVLWLLGDNGMRYCFRKLMTTTFYAAGAFPRLRALWRFLRAQPVPVQLARAQRIDLFDGLLDVMAIAVDTAVQPQLFRRVAQAFPELDYYDADVPVSVQLAAATGVFPTMRCLVLAENDVVLEMQPLESRWELDVPSLPLRILTMQPDSDPAYAPPQSIIVGTGGKLWHYPLTHMRLLLISVQAQLRRHDPDLILTRWGDTWLLPTLIEQADQHRVPLNLSRDQKRPYRRKKASSYFTYGMVLYRGEQTYLHGRWHIDIKNALMFAAYDIDGTLEQARVSGMPVQEMARRSPGAGITAMQMITARQRGVMIPVTKQQSEYYKSARQLLRADRGGLVFQPRIGLHKDVVEIDFVSMYPSIISLFNISPETVLVESERTAVVPELDMPIDQTRRGLLPQTLQPLLQKRIALKTRLAHLPRLDCRAKSYKARATALKWLLVVAFGYAGYKRARYGRIEAHEAITAYSREAMLLAKEAAERFGYEVVHMYVDGLWLKRRGVKTDEAIQPLLDEIERRTGLPIVLEGFYKWIAFLPSKMDERVPVPNRYFGVFETGELKMRGIEARRHDTPPFVVNLQIAVLERLAGMVDFEDALAEILSFVRERAACLQAGEVALEELLISQTLSRTLAEYTVLSPVARAIKQLEAAGKIRHPGQRIRFIYTKGEPGVYAWDLPYSLDVTAVDCDRYMELTCRAVHTVLRPWGVNREWLDARIRHDWFQNSLFAQVEN